MACCRRVMQAVNYFKKCTIIPSKIFKMKGIICFLKVCLSFLNYLFILKSMLHVYDFISELCSISISTKNASPLGKLSRNYSTLTRRMRKCNPLCDNFLRAANIIVTNFYKLIQDIVGCFQTENVELFGYFVWRHTNHNCFWKKNDTKPELLEIRIKFLRSKNVIVMYPDKKLSLIPRSEDPIRFQFQRFTTGKIIIIVVSVGVSDFLPRRLDLVFKVYSSKFVGYDALGARKTSKSPPGKASEGITSKVK